MKKITKKLSTKYVKLQKSRLRQDGSMKSEEGGEIFREKHSPENEESNETKETPVVTKIMESMHRKLMLKEKANKKNINVDGQDQSPMSEHEENEESKETKETPKFTNIMESMHRKLMLKEKANKKNIHVDSHDQSMSERSVRNGGRDRRDDQLEGSVRNMNRADMDQLVSSIRNGHMDHLEDLIRGRDRTEGSIRNGGRDRADQLEGFSKTGQKPLRENVTHKSSSQVDHSEGSTKNPSDFASKKDYLDWMEYVKGSSHHCFDRSESPEKSYRNDEDIDHDQISVGISEGSVEGNNDEIVLLKSSKYGKNEKFEDLKGYKKGKGTS